MATVYHLVHDTTWEEIAVSMKKAKQQKKAMQLHKLFHQLLGKNPVPNTDQVVVKLEGDVIKPIVSYQSLDKPYTVQLPLYNQWLGWVLVKPDKMTNAEATLLVLCEIIKKTEDAQKKLSAWDQQFQQLQNHTKRK